MSVLRQLRSHVVPALLLCSLVSMGGSEALAGIDLAAVPPTDPAVRTGVLPNGLHYYLRQNAKPAERIELRLGLKVGAVQEEESERGLAHFNEHMNFNGSPSFEGSELIAYLESIGARFGADSNAYTSSDETVYFLQVPTDKPGAVEKGLTILADWAGRATLDGDEIDKERGVVADELRGGKGANKRIADREMPILYKGSRYATRRPIGLEDVIMNASHETVRGFYHRWYRPENIGFAAVGDLDLDEMEANIKRIFGALPTTPAAERIPIPSFDVPSHDETLYAVNGDPELRGSNLSVVYKHDDRTATTGLEMREDFVESVAGYLLTLRLSELAQSADPPFLGAYAGRGGGVKPLKTFTLSARAKEGEIPRAAIALMEELERARAHGFVEAELDRVRTLVLTSAESSYKEREQRRSRRHVSSMIRSFLDGSPLPSAEWNYEFTKQVTPTITLSEVNAAFRRLASTRSRVVLARAPEKEGGAPLPTIDDLRAIIEPKKARNVAAYVDDVGGAELMKEKPTPGRILSRHALPALGVEELVLSNGIQVVVKATDFRNDEISLRGFKHGGITELPEAEWPAAYRGDTLANDSGLGEYTAPQLRKLMSGKLASASLSIGTFTRTAFGNSTPKDFETMLQLLHMRFTQPAFREDAFSRLIDRSREGLKNALNSPRGVYGRARTEVSYDNHPLYRPTTTEEIDALTMADMEAGYRKLFADASGWTFVLVGNIDLDVHAPLIAQYLGSLPAAALGEGDAAPTYESMNIQMPAGMTTRMVAKGVEDQSNTTFMIWAPWGLDPNESNMISAVTDLLQIRLRERLREERGDTYGVGVYSSSLSPYPHYGTINVSWGSSPSTRESMLRDVKSAIDDIRTRLPTAQEITTLREMRYNSIEEGLIENGFWMSQLYGNYLAGRDPHRILGVMDRVDRITPRRVRSTARKYLKMDRTADVFLVPADWGQSKWALSGATGGSTTSQPQGM